MNQMITELAGAKGVATMAGKFLLPATAPFLADAAGIINEQTLLPMTVVCVVGGALWYVKGWMDEVSHHMKDTNLRLKNLEKAGTDAREHHQMICPVGYKYPGACNSQTGQPERHITNDNKPK